MPTHLLTFLIAVAVTAQACAAPIELVQNGTSDYVIFHELTASRSVAQAATELQTYLQRASGAKLPVVHQPAKNMICLGDCAAARAAGVTTENIPWEGFRILVKDATIFLVGRDTADAQHTPGGGTSQGTYNAACHFLEKYVGVRWLIPGDHGDYVPKTRDLTVPDTDFSDAPAMLNRRVPYTQERRADVKQWWRRQGLGWSLYLDHSHNWHAAIPASNFEKHPDWFAERAGVRVPPTGRYKLCTTNAEMVQAYADAAIAYFDRNPGVTCYSLSPSDSAGYCECVHCSALYETDPNGRRSVTPAILTFYNDVAKIVAEKYPNKVLAGYVYAAYLFPPKKNIKLEPNVFVVLTPSIDYGFTLARPAVREQWQKLLDDWTLATNNISYYDLPVNITTEAGALNPPGLEILKFIYPKLAAAHIKGVYVYGVSAWGRAAPLNYLLAKLAWNPNADVEALFDEYCAKAYGAGGDDINQMFRMLDREVARHYREFPDASYPLTTDMLRDIYAKNFTEIEQLYRAAHSKVKDADAKFRLEMIADNLKVLHWNLRQHDLLDEPQTSEFYLSDDDFFRFLSANQGSLALQPRDDAKTPSSVQTKRNVTVPPQPSHADKVQPFRLRGDQHLIVKPTGTTAATVHFSRIAARGKLITYRVFESDGAEVGAGVVSGDVPLLLDGADSSSDYYHVVIAADTASFMIEVDGAAWAVDGSLSDQGLHLLGEPTPLYFYVPEGMLAFHLSVEASPPGETAAATLTDPHGQRIADFDCSRVSVDRQEIKPTAAQTGWWKLDVHKAQTGMIDDVWVKLESPLSGYFTLDPKRAADIR